jgi:flagellar hook-length control protein FliK
MDFAIQEGAPISAKTGDAKPVDGNLLVHQISEQLSRERDPGSGRIKITLFPENLGSLDMDIMVRENKVQVILTAERSDVRQALQGQADQLRSSLQELGLQVNGIDFLVRGNLQVLNGDAGGGPFWGRENRNGGMKKEKGEEKISLSRVIMSLSERGNGNPVKAGISLYV